MTRLAVCSLGDLAEGRPSAVEAGGRRMVLVRWGERVFAVRDVCPHMSASFARGRVQARVVAAEGDEIALKCDEPMLVCPWHAWEFSLATGLCPADSRLRVRTYPVAVGEDGTVVVTLNSPGSRRDAPSTSAAGGR